MEMSIYDVAVIGGGVVGCAILHELTNQGWRCILLEKTPHLISGASSGNSGTLHSGFDAAPGTLEHSAILSSSLQSSNVFKKYGIPYQPVGALLVAWTNEQLTRLPEILRNCDKTGVHGIKQLSREEIRKMEPHLSTEVRGGLWVPGESIVEPWLIPVTLAHHAVRGGAKIEYNCEVVSGSRTPDHHWSLQTSRGPITAKVCINAAGLYGDRVEDINNSSPFKIQPRKGEFVVFNKTAKSLIRHIIMPVPTPRTKGVLLFPTVYGNVVIGPTAVDVNDRDDKTVSEATKDHLLQEAYRIMPGLRSHDVVGTYAGLRPATKQSDYQICAHKARDWITVAGIRSTGLTACLGIAGHVSNLLREELHKTPSQPSIKSQGTATAMFSSMGSVVLDGMEYIITHPITRFGHEVTSKL